MKTEESNKYHHHFNYTVMKTKTVNQEILLMTTTTFSQREWSVKDTRSNKPLTPNDQLEEACWNGPFKLAIEKQVPIVPVVNLNNWELLQN